MLVLLSASPNRPVKTQYQRQFKEIPMNGKHKILAILLAGIVSFSSNSIISNATQPADSSEETESEETEPSQISIESNEIQNWPTGPSVSADSAIVMDASTGTILYSKNIDARQYPASITKIMTTLVALENSALDETVVFSQNAVFSIERNSSHIARTTDEELTMEQCLYAIMLESANECANAVAEHIAGSTEAFADMMNAKAAELGCTNTHFVNAHGLHDENHYTSARDMALITQAALKNDTFRQIVGTVKYTLPPTNKNDQELVMFNHHAMMTTHRTSLYLDDTVFAGKTGYTTDALNTLVTCAARNDMDLICVLLRGPSGTPYPDTEALLDYVTDNFAKVSLPATLTEFPDDVRSLVAASAGECDASTAYQTDASAGYVVLPNTVSFESLTPQVTVQGSEDSSELADIIYYYETVPLGNACIHLDLVNTAATTWDTEPAAADDTELPVSDDTDRNQNSSFIKYVIFAIVIIIALLLAALILLLIRAHQENIRRKRRMERRKRRRAARIQRAIPDDDFDDFSQLEGLNEFNFRQHE